MVDQDAFENLPNAFIVPSNDELVDVPFAGGTGAAGDYGAPGSWGGAGASGDAGSSGGEGY